MEDELFEVFVPVGGPRDELMTVKWAYDNLTPENWCYWGEAGGVIVRFKDREMAEVFCDTQCGFMDDFGGLIVFRLQDLNQQVVRDWCEENVQSRWRMITRRSGALLILENDDEAMLFRLSFD